ncbi:hypothetical protein EI94DRAFT_1180146 [Lactarius quietus]|nr:hypothetical protein EI94DRAFT_1180146 [Lactarius quietus]
MASDDQNPTSEPTPPTLFWEYVLAQRRVLVRSRSSLQIQCLDTSPELQHEFCPLWNHIVREVLSEDHGWISFYILGQNRNVYVALHQGTDSVPTRFSAFTDDQDDILWKPSAYPSCYILGHHSDSDSDLNVRMAIARAILEENRAPAPASLLALLTLHRRPYQPPFTLTH